MVIHLYNLFIFVGYNTSGLKNLLFVHLRVNKHTKSMFQDLMVSLYRLFPGFLGPHLKGLISKTVIGKNHVS